MKIVIKESRQKNLIYIIDEVSQSPISADIITKENTKNHIINLLLANPSIKNIESVNMLEYDLF
jgi:hypothetical protein